MKPKLLAVFLFLPILIPQKAFSYGEAGHEIVGAIADKQLAGQPAAEAVKKLLGSITLQRAATLPDELKEDSRGNSHLSLPENKELETALLDFRAANPPTEDQNHVPPSHHWFHYTDVPVDEANYAAGKLGRSQWDIVHMIPYCIHVLRGDEKPDNERKITPAVALVLLTHFVGDIHQPLHVGAIYLHKDGTPRTSKDDVDALPTAGGNQISFGAGTLHGYWDFDTVESAINYRRHQLGKRRDEFSIVDYATALAGSEPKGWKADPSWTVDQLAEKWADEILPIAKEAYERLRYYPADEVKDRHGAMVPQWPAVAKPRTGKETYYIWSSDVVADELAKGGWRLAALLEAIFPAAPAAK